MAVRETPQGVVFLRQLVPGGTNKSYGLHVARLAGLPAEVLTEAARVLQYLERQEGQPVAPTLPVTANGSRPHQVTQPIAVLAQQLLEIDICQMTPLQALSLLHNLQQQARTLLRNREVSP
jgi:DNA mismatch repair protein MutS